MTWQVVTLVCVLIAALFGVFLVIWTTFWPIEDDQVEDERIQVLMDAYHNNIQTSEENRRRIAEITARVDQIVDEKAESPQYAVVEPDLGANGPDLAQYPRITEPMDPYDAYIPSVNVDWEPMGDDDVRAE